MKSKIIFTEPDFKVHIEFSEVEARALHDIVGYGAKNFLEVFKEKLGSHYINKHEQGLITFFERLKTELPMHFAKFDKAKEAYNSFNKDI